MQTLAMNIDKAKSRVPEAIRQAYCIVVTVSKRTTIQAFKITVTDDPHFTTIKADKRARIQDTAIAADALLPGRPLRPVEGRRDEPAGQGPGRGVRAAAAPAEDAQGRGHPGHPGRRVRAGGVRLAPDPAGRHVPHVVAVAARRNRPKGPGPGAGASRGGRTGRYRARTSSRRSNSPNCGRATRSPSRRLSITSRAARWCKSTAADTPSRSRFPKACPAVVEKAVAAAVEAGVVWLRFGPASLLAEVVPAGILTPAATLAAPPTVIPAAQILPENLPDAWKENRPLR